MYIRDEYVLFPCHIIVPTCLQSTEALTKSGFVPSLVEFVHNSDLKDPHDTVEALLDVEDVSSWINIFSTSDTIYGARHMATSIK